MATIVDRVGNILWVDGEARRPSMVQIQMLEYLVRHQGQAVSGNDMFDYVYRGVKDPPFYETLRVHMVRMRRLLIGSTYRIDTIRGYGYRLLIDDDSDDVSWGTELRYNRAIPCMLRMVGVAA